MQGICKLKFSYARNMQVKICICKSLCNIKLRFTKEIFDQLLIFIDANIENLFFKHLER